MLVYTYADMFADFGGYMGLLLGGSIVSMFDLISHLAVKLIQFLKRKSHFGEKTHPTIIPDPTTGDF